MDLFEVQFSAQDFPADVSRSGILKFSDDDLAHALFTTGRAPGDELKHGMVSVWEFIHRASVIPAYIRRTPSGLLRKSALAQDLDRSEKVGLSYSLGQALTAIFCGQRLRAAFMMHVDRYAASYNLSFGLGRQRPDLFGQIATPGRTSAMEWIVAESKGRSNGMEASLVRKMKKQKGMVKSIDGRPPKVCLGCVASFPLLAPGSWGPMRVDAVDPQPSKEAVDLPVAQDMFQRAYYEPFVAAIRFGTPDEDSETEYVTADLGVLGVRVGLRRDIYESMTRREGVGSPESQISISEGQGVVVGGRGTRYPDGTLIEARWSDALSIRDYEG